MTVSSLTAGAGQLGSSPAGQLKKAGQITAGELQKIAKKGNRASVESWIDNSWRIAKIV
jgi:hypothetical protein